MNINTLASENSLLLKITINSSQLIFCLSFFTTSLLFSQTNQNKKVLNIKRSITTSPKIDGLLTDPVWKGLEVANDLIIMEPNNGEKENPDYKTDVKVMYDDEAIYVSAMMYDPNPSKIAMEFASRDTSGQADHFTVVLNPNNDGLNATLFQVMTTGTQVEAKVSNEKEDRNWSALWKSAVKILDNGWSLEMKIPYAALRFSEKSFSILC